MTCPNCKSTDIGDIVHSDKCVCLDCDFVWLPRARRVKKWSKF